MKCGEFTDRMFVQNLQIANILIKIGQDKRFDILIHFLLHKQCLLNTTVLLNRNSLKAGQFINKPIKINKR